MPARRDIFTGRMNFLERGWGGMEPYDRTLQGELRSHGVYTHITTDHTHYFELGGKTTVLCSIPGTTTGDRKMIPGYRGCPLL